MISIYFIKFYVYLDILLFVKSNYFVFIFIIKLYIDFASYGHYPHIISYRHIPNDQMSAFMQ